MAPGSERDVLNRAKTFVICNASATNLRINPDFSAVFGYLNVNLSSPRANLTYPRDNRFFLLENGSEILYNIEKSERGAEMKNGKICILIADDEKEIRDILRLLLTGEGYAVCTAENGKEALVLASAEVDLYLLDVNMPELSGFMAGSEIRKQFNAPIIFLTAYSGESDKVMGFSAGADDYIVKIHVHTNDPGLAIQKALTYGSLSRIKIDNMREEHQEKLIKDSERLAAQQKAEEEAKEKKEEPRKKYGFIAVSVGEGLSEIFKGIGADYIIEGGQTMNPSTEDMLEAIEKVHAETVYILPNNKNIILAAEQAKSLSEDTKVYVVPSKTVPQGITALINFAPDLTAEENMEQMTEEMSHVKTGQITYAVRNTSIDGMEIAEGDIMGIGDSGMLAVGKNIEETAMESLRKMVDDESELVTIYYGEDVTEEDAEAFCEKARKEFTSCEFECQNGGQPIYYYMISVE